MADQDETDDQRDAVDDTDDRDDGPDNEEPKQPERRTKTRQERRDDQFRSKYQAEKEARERLEAELADRDAKAGDWKKTAERYKRQLEEVSGERDEWKGNYEGLTGRLRTDALVERLMTASGVQSKARIKGLIAVAVAEGSDLDPAPENSSDRDVKDWLKELQKHDPSTFEQPKSGRQAPAPGASNRLLSPGENPDESKWAARARNADKAGGSRPW